MKLTLPVDPLLSTELKEYPLFRRGKVRDVYDMGDKLLIVATDRLSAFDVVLPDGIPGKGILLNQMSLFWFDLVKGAIPNHLLVTDAKHFPKELQKHIGILDKRSVIVKKAQRFDVECVVRGYITGSGWNDYQKTGKICGITLPKGLVESQKLETPIFTPSSKVEDGGHDENIDFAAVVKMIGQKNAESLRDLSISIYNKAHDYARTRGIILADTKFEFGLVDGRVTLIDEILSPDSSRFWPQKDYAPGRGQASFDKQYVRDYLIALKWDKRPPGPKLPGEVIKNTVQKYQEAYQLICG